MDNQPIHPPTPTPISHNSSKTFLLILGAIVLMAVSGVGGYYLGANKQSQSYQPPTRPSQSLPTPTAIPTPMSDETVYTEATRSANWKTYTNNEFNFKFKYPKKFSLKEEKTSTVYYVHLKSSDEELTFEVLKTNSDNLLSHLPTEKKVTSNTLTWSYHGTSEYCDAGSCGSTAPGYTTRKNGLLISLYLYNTTPKSTSSNQILSTFKFTK